MKNIVNELIKSMELNNYNFKVEESGWNDTITLIIIIPSIKYLINAAPRLSGCA